MTISLRLLPLLLALSACNQVATEPATPAAIGVGDGVFVQMFEWKWTDLALECEQHLGPAGYSAVQTSPPQEHIPGPQWWTRYQPVSYRIESRSGTREEFADMVARCAAAGVDVYADAVINHMADVGDGTGVAGSAYAEFDYPVPYGFDDFHHCGRNEGNRIEDYQDAWEVQNCQLGDLADLNTDNPGVQARIGAYMNDLLSLGVAGFRLDAIKHIAADDVRGILDKTNGSPFIVQEVIDRGGEPIKAADYVEFGRVTEFRFASAIYGAFMNADIEQLNAIGHGEEWLPSKRAVVFIDNHDTQRSHLGDNVLNYKAAVAYDLATVFMLGHPYGYPVMMSSYSFEHDDDPVPTSSPHDADKGCGAEWVCEHRRELAIAMVKFRTSTAGEDVSHWRAHDEVVSFSRGDKGHVVINVGEETGGVIFATNLADGKYQNVLGANTGAVVIDGQLQIELQPRSAAVFYRNN